MALGQADIVNHDVAKLPTPDHRHVPRDRNRRIPVLWNEFGFHGLTLTSTKCIEACYRFCSNLTSHFKTGQWIQPTTPNSVPGKPQASPTGLEFWNAPLETVTYSSPVPEPGTRDRNVKPADRSRGNGHESPAPGTP